MGEHSKSIVAGIMAILIILDQATGWSPGGWLTAEWLTSLLAILTPALVWWFPNRA